MLSFLKKQATGRTVLTRRRPDGFYLGAGFSEPKGGCDCVGKPASTLLSDISAGNPGREAGVSCMKEVMKLS
jgi:hypothetical protein